MALVSNKCCVPHNRLIYQQEGNVSWRRESAQKGLNPASRAQFAALPYVKPVVWFARAVINYSWRACSQAISLLWNPFAKSCAPLRRWTRNFKFVFSKNVINTKLKTTLKNSILRESLATFLVSWETECEAIWTKFLIQHVWNGHIIKCKTCFSQQTSTEQYKKSACIHRKLGVSLSSKESGTFLCCLWQTRITCEKIKPN